MIKGAIFDVDGTLLESMDAWKGSGAKYLASIGVEAESNLDDVLSKLSIPAGAAYMKEHYKLTQSEDEIGQGVLDVVRDFYFFEAGPKAHVYEFMEYMAAHEIPMVLATSSDKVHITTALERLGIMKYFDEILTCNEVGAGKVEPLIYHVAAEHMGTNPEETVVFEDVIHAIRSANRGNFITVGVYDKSSDRDKAEIISESNIYMNDLSELDKLEKLWK